MNDMLIATAGGLMAALCWGTADWLSAKSSKKLSPFQINFGLQIAGSLLLVPLFFASDFQAPSMEQLVTVIEAAFLITLAYILFVKALTAGAVGIITPIANSYPLVTVVLTVLLTSQIFTDRQTGALMAILAGSALLAYEKNHKKIPLKELHKDTILAIAAAVIWGIAFYVLNPLVDQLNWQTLTILIEGSLLPMSSILFLVMHRKQPVKAARQALRSKQVWLIGFVYITGGAALYLSSDYAASIVIPAVLSAGGSLVASIWSSLFDHERLTYIKRFGAVIVVAGIALLNIN